MASAHKSVNKSTVMAEGCICSTAGPPNITKTQGARLKNPRFAWARLQQTASDVSHISRRSKHCVTVSAGEKRSIGAGGCVQRGGGAVGGLGDTRHRLLTAPLDWRGQSTSGSWNSQTNGQPAAPPSSHCQNTKLFLDLFGATSAARKGSNAASWLKVATAAVTPQEEQDFFWFKIKNKTWSV